MNLLFLGVHGKGAPAYTSHNIVFLVDVSGSMCDRWELVQMSLAALVARLGENDTISIVTYSNKTRVVSKGLSCGNKEQCVDAILSIHADGGGTYGSDALERSYSILAYGFDPAADNRVMIFTDGDFNFGITDETSLADFIYTKRLSGIYLSVIGYGLSNIHDDNMKAMSRNGNGNYCFIGCKEDIQEYLYDKFGSLTNTIAKDVKIKVEFNPQFIEEFRQIGYEVRQLTEQEFHDERKAVDSIGVGHSMIAVFEIVPADADKPSTVEHRYTSTVINGNTDELGFVTVKYKLPDNTSIEFTLSLPLIELSDTPNTRTASFLTAWGLYLRNTEYRHNLSVSVLEELAKQVIADGKHDDIVDVFNKTINSSDIN